MNHKLKLLACSFFCTYATNIIAQNTQKINLQEAIDLTLKNSNNIKIADAKILEAAADVQQALDRKLPDVNVTGSYVRLSSANIKMANSQNINKTPAPNQAAYGIINASLPIYTGGKINYAIEAAKYLQEAAKLNAENDKQGIVYNGIKAYTNLFKASKTVSVIKDNLSASILRDTVFSRLEQNGILARNDLLKAQLQTSNIELALLDAENNVAIAMVNMNLMLGLPENTLLEIDTNFIQKQPTLQPFINLENAALQNRKDAQALGYQKKAAAVGIKIAHAEAYPNISLTGGYIAADIPKLITITNAVNIGVGIQYNIANLWKSNTKLTQAKAKQTQIMATENLITDGIRLQVNSDYQYYLLAQKKIDVYNRASIQATENYRITKNKYDNSLVTITDLLDADVSLLQTKLNVVVAQADAALAYNKLLATCGSLIPY